MSGIFVVRTPGGLYQMMERTMKQTADGSYTLYEPQFGVTYHSVYGAVQESRHVFIASGLHYWMENHASPQSLRILEVGFGTGLNALLTLDVTQGKAYPVFYQAIEPFPLASNEAEALCYPRVINRPDLDLTFRQMHQGFESGIVNVSPGFVLHRYRETVQRATLSPGIDLVYFDAFAPDVQPELWTTAIFQKLFDAMAAEAVLVTYSSKGTVRRALVAAGFAVEKIPGPPHKREIVRALKVEREKLPIQRI